MKLKTMTIAAALAALGLTLSACDMGHPGHNSDHHRGDRHGQHGGHGDHDDHDH